MQRYGFFCISFAEWRQKMKISAEMCDISFILRTFAIRLKET